MSITFARQPLVIHDGMNEAMALHGAMTKEVEGAALFRQRLLVPFLLVNAATLTCDLFPMAHDNSRLDAYGSVHKGTALSGAQFSLENVESFGRGLRGRSNLFVTKTGPDSCAADQDQRQEVAGLAGDRQRPDLLRKTMAASAIPRPVTPLKISSSAPKVTA